MVDKELFDTSRNLVADFNRQYVEWACPLCRIVLFRYEWEDNWGDDAFVKIRDHVEGEHLMELTQFNRMCRLLSKR